MPPTLAELRAQSGPKPLPKATVNVTMVEGQHLLAKSQQLNDELVDLLVEQEREKAKDDEGRDRVRKAGEQRSPENPRIDELREEMQSVVDQLAEFQAKIEISGYTGGNWQRYKDEHPPREDNQADLTLARGMCNSSDLFNDLGRFVVSWDGEELDKSDWSGWLAERICYADRRDLVTEIVDLHENKLPRAPKSQSSSSPTGSSETD